jgi:hypothetical protein
MIESLRPSGLGPSSLGEILDRTAQIYRSRFLVFFGIAAIPAGVVLVCAAGVFLFSAWSGSGAAKALGPEAQAAIGIAFFLCAVLLFLPLCIGATALGMAALSQAASAAFLGETITIREACKAVWKRGWRYIWLFVLEVLIIGVAPFVWCVVVGVVVGVVAALAKQPGGDMSAVSSALLLVLMAVAGAYAVWMLLRLCLAFPACVVEQLAVWPALKRASSLSKGTRLRMLLLYVLGAILGWLLAMLLSLPVMFIVFLFPGANSPQHEQTVGMIFLFTFYGASFAVQALTKPVYGIALMLFYYDQRIRNEGFDIEWMMRQAGMVAAPAPEPEAAPWMPAVLAKPRPAETMPASIAAESDAVLAEAAEVSLIVAQPSVPTEPDSNPEQLASNTGEPA